MWTSDFYPRFCQGFQEFSTSNEGVDNLSFSVDEFVDKMWICGVNKDCPKSGIA